MAPAGIAPAGIAPVRTTEADWRLAASALGRTGKVMGGTVYRVSFPRRDLRVTSYGVAVKAGLSLGGYAGFARYPDRVTLMMGDLIVTEPELQKVTDALHARGLEQTALHKHLLAHQPPVWWTHFHGMGSDAAALARGLKAALDVTATPPATTPGSPPPVDLDTAGIDAALGAKGTNDGGIYKFTFARTETITDHGRILPPGFGVTTAIGFQPAGGRRAAINGDFAMVADEVNKVIVALRRGGISIVELHNHMLMDDPRLFYMHFWAVDGGTKLARALRPAIDATRVRPAG
ncbi:MAG TPA: DUF1259 domain-containing protein [Streptosporangiaceae bacterium]|jgi:hypothetical protein|nr:DUF1259 domain-containing protein [Streptosporangiaceae bacterium]